MRNGFSLIELMVVLAVISILMSIGVPSFRTLMADNQITNSSNELLYALQIARTEAVKRNSMVSLCPSSDQSTCTGNGSWHVGWIIFIDTNNNGARENAEEIIRVQNALDTTVTLAGPNAIQYATGGYLSPAAMTTIQASATGSTNNKWVCLTAIGKAKVQSTSC
jgi:type IV fimbrial biogenesis protein FimT